MTVLSAQSIAKRFGDDEIFFDISVSIPPQAKLALVGPNGAGKSTLLKVLIGQEPPSEGTIARAKDTRIGYLPQNASLDGAHSVYDEMLTAFADLRAQEERLKAFEAQLDSADEDMLIKYGEMQEAFEQAGGYTYEIHIEQVLHGLGFPPEMYDRPLDALSGGQKTRALLGRLLLEKPDLLALDEPTNHLDIQTIEWLENYLRNFPGAILMVSHDRYFMDSVVSLIWELDWGEIEVYSGNYSHYLQQRAERHERRQKEYEAQQAYIQKEQDYIQKHIASQNTAQAKGRRRRLERLMSGTDRHGRAVENPWLKKPPRARQTLHVKLKSTGRTGDHVLRTQRLQVGYNRTLFEAPDVLLLRGEIAAIIGANGVGKSTFIKTLLGRLEPLGGAIQWGAQVDIGYFAQAHEDLDESKSLLDELLSVRNLPISEARSYLAQYLFHGDDVFRPVSTLSGGERGRLALAKLALDGANVLLLDEPTNHLDIPSQEILQDVLASFEGTVLLISHDRYLINALASQIWHITPGKMRVFEGSYAEYQAALRAEAAPPMPEQASSKNKAPAKTSPKKHGLNPYQREKRIAELESLIHSLEDDLHSITNALADASEQGNVGEVARLGENYSDTETRLNDAMEEWVMLSED
ncbi:MAG: ribosomal protection-like ABC-F family protein [Anaerolineales bacterium]